MVKRDVTDFCKTLSEDTTNYMQGNAETPFGEPKVRLDTKASGVFIGHLQSTAHISTIAIGINCKSSYTSYRA